MSELVASEPAAQPSWLDTKFALAIEVCAVLFIYQNLDRVVVAGLKASKFDFTTVSLLQLYLIITLVSLVAVLAITFLSQKLRGMSLAEYGLVRALIPNAKTGLLLILGSFLWQIVCTFGIEKLAVVFGARIEAPSVKTLSDMIPAMLLSFVSGGLREELFFRGYLIKQVSNLCKPLPWSIIIACSFQVLLFGFNHLYQGIVGAVEAGIGAIVFTLIYLRRMSLWDAILFHSFYDVFGFWAIYFRL